MVIKALVLFKANLIFKDFSRQSCIFKYFQACAYAAPNKGITILYWFRYPKTVFNPPVNGKIQGLFNAFECFSSTFQGKFNLCFKANLINKDFSREPSGSVLECLTPDRRAAGLSLAGITSLWSLSKTHLSLLCTGSTQVDPSPYNWKIVDGT